MRQKQPPEVLFWRKVDKSGVCWLWTGSVRRNGYGQLTTNQTTKLAHRFAYELTKGPIPTGLQIDHLCRNRRCVNPDHLEPVTQRTNLLRGVGLSAENARKTRCLRGHEFTPENTYVKHARGSATRVCRTCQREGKQARQRVRKAQEAA